MTSLGEGVHESFAFSMAYSNVGETPKRLFKVPAGEADADAEIDAEIAS